MAGDQTTRQEMWNLYIQGKTPVEAEQLTKYNYSTVKKYYADFTIEAVYAKSNNRDNEIRQASAIERELFEVLARFHKKPSADLYNQSIQLQNTYCKYNALS